MREPTFHPWTQAYAPAPGATDAARVAPFPLPQRLLLVARAGDRATHISEELRRQGLSVGLLWQADGLAAAVAATRPDVILADGRSFRNNREAAAALEAVRTATQGDGTPILLVGDPDAAGAWDLLLVVDDFVLEPLRAAEVVTRAALLTLRSSRRAQEGAVVAGRMMLDLIGHKVLVEGREVYLTHREFELVHFLMTNRGRVVTREMVAQHLWGPGAAGGLRTVDVHIRRIRSKLEHDGGRFIETVRNVGYKFVAE